MLSRQFITAVLCGTSVVAAGCSGDVITPPATGALQVVTFTSGDDPDPDGYTVQVDEAQPQPIESEGSVSTGNLPLGNHTVTLTGLSANCTATEGLSQSVTVSDRTMAVVRFSVSCRSTQIADRTSIAFPSGVAANIARDVGRTIWGTSASDLFVIAGSPSLAGQNAIWHWDGASWTEQVHTQDTVFNGLWGFSGGDVYAVGNGTWMKTIYTPVIRHYDGVQWSEMAVPVSGKGDFTSLWGAAPADIFLAGVLFADARAALVAHFDGDGWSRVTTPVFGDRPWFTNLAGTSAGDLWVIGHRETCEDCNHSTAMIVHFDGQQWLEQFGKNADEYHGVWAVSPNDVWVVGQNDEGNAVVLHYDGSNWIRSEPISQSQNALQDVWAGSSDDVYAVGPGVLLHYNGQTWSKISDIGGDRVWGTSGHLFILRSNEILQQSR